MVMALFRGVRRIFRRPLFLFFVLLLIGTVFLCGLEVLKYKSRPMKSGLSDTRSFMRQHYQLVGKRQQRHGDVKDSRLNSLSDGSRKNYGEAPEDEKKEDISDKRIESDNEVFIEEEKENEQNNEGDESLGEYEDDFDPADRKNKEIKKDSFDNKEAQKENEDELEEQEEQIEQEKGPEQEEFKKGEEEQEEKEFEDEGEDEIVEDEQVKPLAGDNEEFRQKQSYGTKVVHEDKKYVNENTAVPDEEIEYFQHNTDAEDEPEDHKELDEHEEREKQEEERKQEQQNEQDDLEEQDEEVEKYRKLVNLTEGLENVQSEANTVTRSENGAESMKHYDYKKAQMHEISDEAKQENEGVPLNEITKNGDLTMGEEEENEITPSNENQSREKMVAKSEIVDRQTQNNSVDSIKRQDTFIKEGQLERFAAAQEKTIKTESVSNRSIERKNGSEVLEGPSYEEQEKEGNTEVEDVNNKNAASTEEGKIDVNGSNKAERPTGENISVYSRNEEENMGERKEQEDEVTVEAHSAGKGSELVTAERHVNEKRAGTAIQDKESDYVKHLKEDSANKTHEADEVKSQNNNEMDTEEKGKRGETTEKVPEMNKGVELPTDNVGKESAVKLNENVNVTEAREMDKEDEPDSFNVEDDESEKSTESSDHESHETEKNSPSDDERLEENRAEKESLKEYEKRKEKETGGNDKNEERHEEVYKNGAHLNENKETVEPTDQKVDGDEQDEDNDDEHGEGTKTSKRVEVGNGQNKNNMSNEEDKPNTVERTQNSEGETRGNETGNEYMDKVRDEAAFESKDGTKNKENESKENKNYEEEKENAEGENNRNKTKREDVEENVKDFTESSDAERPLSTTAPLARTVPSNVVEHGGNYSYQNYRDDPHNDEKAVHEEDSVEDGI